MPPDNEMGIFSEAQGKRGWWVSDGRGGRIGEQGWNMGNLAPSGKGDAPGGRTLGSVLWKKGSNGKN